MTRPTAANDESWMEHAIRLAMVSRGDVEPNPMVGCVIVRDGRVIGQGRHEQFGGLHAEPNALASCGRLTEGATAYVTLEPCCHTKKKTPPCVPALIAAGISRVVIGCLDPYPAVRGRGVKQLRGAGIKVDVGVLEEKSKQLNAPYFAGVLHHRPYVTLKWAQSSDNKVAGPLGKRRTISNKTSLAAMHALRSRCDAILVSLRTVQSDDPLLTVRGVLNGRTPLRVVLDPELLFEPRFQLAKTAHQFPLLIYCSRRTHRTRSAGITALLARKITAVPVASSGGHLSLIEVCADLHHRGVTHLLVEPGPRLARAFMAANLADRIWIFRSPKRIGHDSAPAAATVSYPPAASVNLDGDTLTEYLNPASDVYFAAEPSADIAAIQ